MPRRTGFVERRQGFCLRRQGIKIDVENEGLVLLAAWLQLAGLLTLLLVLLVRRRPR
jgi:hypothetical protein